jgi:DNA-binding MarR family transcriptional regulator
MLILQALFFLGGFMQKTASPDSAGRCHCTALRKASRRISHLYDLALAPSGLKATQRAILAKIARLESTTVGALAEAMVMEAGGLAHTLKPLVRDGLVSIGPDPNDKRSRAIKLTAAGKARLRQSEKLWDTAQQVFEKQLGRDQVQVLNQAIGLLISDGFGDKFESAITASG